MVSKLIQCFVFPNLNQYSNVSPRGPLFAGVHKLGDTGHYIVYGQFNHFNDTTASCIAVIDDSGNLQSGYFNGTGAHGNLLINGIGTWLFYPTIQALHETADGDLVLGGSFGKFDDAEHYSVLKLKRGTVGTNDDNGQRNALHLCPNPASTNIRLHLPGSVLTHATLYDMQGREVLSVSLNYGEPVIDVNTLPGGMYLVRATAEGGRSFIQKLIVE